MQSNKIHHARNLPFLRNYYQNVFKPKEHEPAHIHALYEEYIGTFDIKTFDMIEGDLPIRAQQLVKEWLTIHQDSLQEMWNKQVIVKLPPL